MGTPTPAVLGEIERILAEGGDRTRAAARIVDAIRRSGPHRWVGLYDVDGHAGVVANIAWSGPGAPAYPVFPVTRGLTSRAIATQQSVNVGDVAADPDYLTALGGTRSELIVPILDRTSAGVVGTLDVESERLGAFDGPTQALIERCATLLTAFLVRDSH